MALDQHGNLIGGVRTPEVDVPASTLFRIGSRRYVNLLGDFRVDNSVPVREMAILYGSKANYLSKYTTDLDKAISRTIPSSLR